MEPTTKRTRGGSRKPLIATESVLQPEHTDAVANLAAVLDNPEGRKLSERVSTLESDLKKATSRVADMAKEKTTLEGLLATSRAEAEQYSSLLSSIATTLGARCKVEELPDAVATMRQWALGIEQALSQESNELFIANHYLSQKVELAESLTAQLAQVQADATEEVLKAHDEAGKFRVQNQILRWWLTATALALIVTGLVGWLYSWGGAPKQLTPGGETAQTLQGGAK